MFVTKKFLKNNHYDIFETLCEFNEHEHQNSKHFLHFLSFKNLHNLVNVFNKKKKLI
jgi:hypothetical protein